MQSTIELILGKYVDVLLRENLDQSKTKLVIKDGNSLVVYRKKVMGSIIVSKNKATFQYEIS